jgi:hypothetical protein
MWRIEFSSDKFMPYLPESAQQNPGAYGFELAHWLSMQLATRCIATGYPLGEDWGWFIEYFEGELEVMIGCQSEAREGDGYTGSPINWRIFVRQPGSLKRRLRGRGPSPKAEEIALAVVSVLEEGGVCVVLTEA